MKINPFFISALRVNGMWPSLTITIKGIFRDRVFKGIITIAFFYLLIPAVSVLSLRRVSELSLTLVLSLMSVVLLLLSVFLGGILLWKDIDRRYTSSVLGLPISRQGYLLGKFFGVAVFIFLTAGVLGICGVTVVKYVTLLDAPLRPIVWGNVLLAFLFLALKYILLAALSLLLSTVSTSFFLPIFGAVALFFAGHASQQVYDFLQTPAAQQYSSAAKAAISGIYYVLPNFSSFDLTVQAVYGTHISVERVFFTLAYFFLYIAIILVLSVMVFSRREL